MSQTWFTADTHFGHGNILKYCARPFLSSDEQQRATEEPRGRWRVSQDSIERHDAALLAAINDRVGVHDTLWILGDFCLGDIDTATRYRQRIHCEHVHLIWGNHDHRSIEPLFDRCLEQGMIKCRGQRIWLNHYPMRSWDASFHGSWHLYGHVHGRLHEEDSQQPWRLTRDVGVDACDYRPLSFDDLREYMLPRQKAFEDHKDERS